MSSTSFKFGKIKDTRTEAEKYNDLINEITPPRRGIINRVGDLTGSTVSPQTITPVKYGSQIDILSSMSNQITEEIDLQVIRESNMAAMKGLPTMASSNTRANAAEELIALLRSIDKKIYPFGGYVRDKIAKTEFSDIDVYVPRSIPLTHVIAQLEAENSKGVRKWKFVFNPTRDSYYDHLPGAEFRVNRSVIGVYHIPSCTSLSLDLIQSKSLKYDDDHAYIKLDIDINCVAENADGDIFSPIPAYRNSVNDAIAKIKDKKFTVLGHNVDQKRISKLISKGFTQLDDAILTNQKHKKESIKMKAKPAEETVPRPSFMEALTKDAEKGAYRTGATQGIKALKVAVGKILAHQGFESTKATAIMELFETPIGEGLLRMALGYGLMMAPVPGIQENEYAQKLSEELRVSGMAGGMDYVADMASQFVIPALMEAYQNTPLLENVMGTKEKMRLPEIHKKDETSVSTTSNIEDEEEDNDEVPVKRVRATRTSQVSK